MADKELRSVRFPGLDDRYVVPEGGTGGSGQDGYSPVAKVEATADGAMITITDKTGTTEVEVKNGKDGAKGADGAPGKDGSDGHTPVITAEKSGKVTNIKADGVTIATVNDGEDGTNGTDGAPGAKGDTGATPDIQIGTVTTLDAGADATASMSGTAENPMLNLGIPKGADGASGGGAGGTYRLVSDTTLAEATNLVTITQDIHGNPFELTDCLVWIFAAVTEESLIQVIPNSVWASGTVVTFANKAKTDYSYDYLAYCHGDTDGFYGYAIIDRVAAAGTNTFFNNARLMKATPQKLTSMKISCKFAAGARIMIYGR